MSSSDSTSVPYLKDIRVIALPEGISGWIRKELII
jgi:hypothetical protein